jgi:hypothetical protein
MLSPIRSAGNAGIAPPYSSTLQDRLAGDASAHHKRARPRDRSSTSLGDKQKIKSFALARQILLTTEKKG